MAITFRVDDVRAVKARLGTEAIESRLAGALNVRLTRVSHRAALVEHSSEIHPLLYAVHTAFAEHRPLSLSPDHLWLALAQGFATHVDENAEALRDRFVRHKGRAAVKATVLEMPTTGEGWAALIDDFGRGVEAHVGPGVRRLFACSFSTTTAVERVAADVVMMSAFRRYFDYVVLCICGIPEVTLEGSADDWAEIRRRLDVIAEYDLEWWVRGLRPVFDAIEKSARGEPDRDFWQCIYKPQEAYGDRLATGWIMRLFPYLQYKSGSTARNPAALEGKNVKGREGWITQGVSIDRAPSAFSRAPLVVFTDGARTDLDLYGGFAGVRQLDDGALRPEIGWAVGDAPRMTRIVERIIEEHAARPPVTRGG